MYGFLEREREERGEEQKEEKKKEEYIYVYKSLRLRPPSDEDARVESVRYVEERITIRSSCPRTVTTHDQGYERGEQES